MQEELERALAIRRKSLVNPATPVATVLVAPIPAVYHDKAIIRKNAERDFIAFYKSLPDPPTDESRLEELLHRVKFTLLHEPAIDQCFPTLIQNAISFARNKIPPEKLISVYKSLKVSLGTNDLTTDQRIAFCKQIFGT
jgi:hypothetical protein